MSGLAYVDTSVPLAFLFQEPGAQEMHARVRVFTRLFSSNLLEAELRAACVREGVPMAKVAASLAAIEWVFPNRSLQPELERALSTGSLRGADLWHVGCALFLDRLLAPMTFVTLDRRQREVAEAAGLSVV
ncbi:MAG TPA: PIN domain-containing protein [Planctomycetota bacterium]|nr:PIN domain-containing protein [Planctomycetota bacterium]